MTTTQGTEILKLNVGGTKYEVSRSLIEKYPDTMLARLISDRWLEDPEQEIFIERNGFCFQYVLDYMRDNRAFPLTVSVASVLQELDYFGFDDVPEGAVDGKSARVTTAKNMAAYAEEYRGLHSSLVFQKSELEKRLGQEIARVEQQLLYESIAFKIFQKMTEQLVLDKEHEYDFKEPLCLTMLNGILSKYGIKCVIFRNVGYSKTFYSLSLDIMKP